VYTRLPILLAATALVYRSTLSSASAAPLSAPDPALLPSHPRDSGALSRRATGGIASDADIDGFKKIGVAKLSANGEWFGYVIAPNVGDGELIVRGVSSGKELRFPAGEVGEYGAANFAFSDDGRWLVIDNKPSSAEADRLRKSHKPLPRSATLIELATGTRTEFPHVQSFEFDGKPSKVLLLTMESSATATGQDLVLYELANKTSINVGNVGESSFDYSGRYFAWTVATRDQTGNGVRVRDIDTGIDRALESGAASYTGLLWADSTDHLAFFSGRPDSVSGDTLYQVVAFKGVGSNSPTRIAFDPAADRSFPAGMTIGSTRPLRWSADRDALFFGIRPVRAKPGTGSEEIPNLVIWHWKDTRLQWQQRLEQGRDDAFTYLALYRLSDKRFVRIADDSLTDIKVAPKDRYALSWNERAYATESSLHGRRRADVYVIDLSTGSRKRVLANYMLVNGLMGFREERYAFSPDGVHFLSWKDGAWTVHNMTSGSTHPLVENSTLTLVDVSDDHPRVKPPIFPMAWSRDGRVALFNDLWDIWAVPIDGGAPTNLTVNGRRDGIKYERPTLRSNLYERVSLIDLDKPWYVSARAHWGMKSGIVRIEGATPGAHKLIWTPQTIMPLKATNADVVALMRGSPTEQPEYWVTDLSFADPRKLTDVGGSQKTVSFSSGSVLIDYRGLKGERLQASVRLPANYVKGKRYPAVVEIYEHLSGDRNAFAVPSRGHAGDPARLNARGYVSIHPDINYVHDRPGSSALHCVEAAVRAAAKAGYVDTTNVGLMGISWGGYESYFIATNSRLIKAVVPMAGLTNLISFYGDIYWANGAMNSQIFESDQARMSTSYLDNLKGYIEQSPIFTAKKTTAAILTMNNDGDKAVDWHQGIEFYNVLRRHGKPIVMLQYVGDGHGVSGKVNSLDFARRVDEFFDHFLQGAPAPKWWTNGVPLREMERHLRERTTPAADSVKASSSR
jgi:dienelactone hydrolase